VATRPVTYGSYSARVVVTATTPSGAATDPNAAWVHIHYLSDLNKFPRNLIVLSISHCLWNVTPDTPAPVEYHWSPLAMP